MAEKEKSKSESAYLKRSMGLLAATSIGVGTMVGAGIFVFPGIAGGYAGPAAMISFTLSGVIALLVAMCTAELATAMPQSGGGYFFVSRSFGTFWGTLTGLSQWIGLVFASAFYLSAFGSYAIELLGRYNLQIESLFITLGLSILLLGVNIIGTKKVGKLQNFTVLGLTLLLLIIFIYGLMDVLGLKGETKLFDVFAPRGFKAIFSTSALIFTSYLGFVQIATIGGEIKKPKENLPKALIGSVLVVMFLYLFVLFVCTSLFSTQELKDLGETATLEVARKLLGDWGALIVLIAGLLAMLSSANASIMSSSRTVFALSKDHLLPATIKKVNKRFKSPHNALLLVVIPVLAMLFVNDLEFFAQVASFLHLLIYGSICTTLLKLRQSQIKWYKPQFRIKYGKLVAISGMICSFGLIVFMNKKSILTGVLVVLVAMLYYYLFQKEKEIPKPEEDFKSDSGN